MFLAQNTIELKPQNDSLNLTIDRDSVTRSIIDPFIIAEQEIPQNSSNLYFYTNYWQKIITKELQRENYSSVKVITQKVKPEPDNKKYFFEGNTDWILIAGIFLVILIAWVRIYYGKVVVQTFRSTVNMQSARKLVSEKSSMLQRASTILSIIYFLGTGLFLYEGINYYHINFYNYSTIYQFIICLSGVLLYYLLKTFFYWFSGAIIKRESEVMEVLSNYNIYFRTIGILILPLIISIPFVPDNIAEMLLYSGIAIFIMSFILRVIRGFVLSFKMKLSLFYSFLYFCILEILPILYVLRIVKVVI